MEEVGVYRCNATKEIVITHCTEGKGCSMESFSRESALELLKKLSVVIRLTGEER